MGVENSGATKVVFARHPLSGPPGVQGSCIPRPEIGMAGASKHQSASRQNGPVPNVLVRYIKWGLRDFSGGPVVKTPHFQCRGRRCHPWLGN